MKIRDYRPEDLSSLHAINAASVPAVGAVTPQELAHIISQSAIALVATTSQDASPSPEIIGFCLALAPKADYGSGNYAWFESRYNDFIYVDRIAIKPAYQGQGLGRRLYDALRAQTSTSHPDAARITLEVNLQPRNEASLAFHARLGFSPVGERDTHYGTRVSLMQKLLEDAPAPHSS